MIETEINGQKILIDSRGAFSPAEEMTIEDLLHDMRAMDAANKRCRSEETIKSHRKHVREKTSQKTASGVLAYCFSKKIIRVLVIVGAVSGVQQFAVSQNQQPINTVRVARFSRTSRQQQLQTQS